MKEFLQKTWAIAWKNLLVLSKDRGELAILFLMPLLFASLIGVFIGSRLASTRDPSFLQRWFVVLLVVVALYVFLVSVTTIIFSLRSCCLVRSMTWPSGSMARAPLPATVRRRSGA